MNTNTEIYSLVLHDAPYVIARTRILWVALIVYVTLVLRRIMRLEKEVAVVEDAVARRDRQDVLAASPPRHGCAEVRPHERPRRRSPTDER